MLLEQDKAQEKIAPRLSSLYFYLSSYCNLNCIHCWIAPRYIDKNEAPEEAPFELLKNIIDQALPLGLKSIKFSGGEPFLSKNIFALIRYASSKDLAIVIETNGTLIDDNVAHFLKENRVKCISVSLDGPYEEIHEAVRGKVGCFAKTIEAIKCLKKHNLNVQVIMSIYKGNIEYLEDTLRLVEQYGIGSFKINYMSQISRGRILKKQGTSLDIERYIALNKKIQEEIQHRHKIKIILDIPPAFMTLRDIQRQACKCAIKNILGVLADGRISICGIGEVVSALVLGDMRKDTLRSIWEGNEILRIIREDVPDRLAGVCAKCIFKAFCLGKCRAEAYYKNNNILSAFSFCEEAFQSGIFPKARMF